MKDLEEEEDEADAVAEEVVLKETEEAARAGMNRNGIR